MKFTVEVEDFWLEEEELTQALQTQVKHDVVQQIKSNIQSQVQVKIKERVDEVIEEKMLAVIDATLLALMDTETIVVNGKEIAIRDHLKNIFQKHHGWSNPGSKMEKIAEKFGNELKLQYNNAFANKIVQNMKQQGLLKDEVVQILLGDKNAN